MKLIFSLLKNNRLKFFFALFLSALSAVTGVIVIAFINDVIGKLSSGVELPFSIYTFLFLIFLLFFLTFISQSLITALGHKVVYELRLSISRRLMNTSVERIDKLGQPAIMATLTNDITAISKAFNSLPFVVFGISVIFCSYAYLLWLSIPFFITTVIMSVFSTLIGRKLMIISRGYKKKVRDNDDNLYGNYQAMLQGRNELKLSQERNTFFYQKLLKPAAEYTRQLDTKADRVTVLNGTWINTSVLLVIAVVVLMHVQFSIGTVEQVTGYALAVLFLRSPMAGFVGSLPSLIQGAIAFAKLKTLELAEEEDPQTKQVSAVENWQVLNLKGIEYDYATRNGDIGFSVGPIDLSINQGELIFWVGGNGCGKSTCARLLTGLYQAHRGSIEFSGEIINQDNLDWYRNHFSVVFADFYLFKNLINEEGNTPDTKLVSYYLNKLALDNKVTVKEGSLNTTELSQGQRKRLALLLAYLENRSIIILDEWAADQDPAFRRIFYTELLPELQSRGKTIIAITHDDHYFYLADKVYRIDAGKISKINKNQQSMETKQ